MAHIDENFSLPVLLNPILSEENRSLRDINGNRILGDDADVLPPRQLVLEPRLAEDLVRRAEEAPALEQTPNPGATAIDVAEPGARPAPAELPPVEPNLENPDILGVLNEESLDIGTPRSFVENFQADLRDELALEVLQAPQVLAPETPAVTETPENGPGDENLQEVLRPEELPTAVPPPRDPETVITERGHNIDRLI